jgi:pimeloyl-ACP methyl ester carboxylesterase
MASCRRRFPLESSNGELGRPATEANVEVSVREARVRGHSIRYEVTGEGEPVVLVHGLSGSTRWWVRNVPALAEHHRLYLVDLPGFGAMRHLRRQFTLVESASWLSAWMEAVGLGPAHLVGYSMGGYICLRFAASGPEAVCRLVLIASAGVPNGRSMLGHLFPLLGAGFFRLALLLDLIHERPRR